MDAPKCPLCGKREWSHVCGPLIRETQRKAAKPHKRSLEPHHAAWLNAHPERDEAWLAEKIRDGFCVHHCDGNSENDDPSNMVLIEGKDHHLLHKHRLVGAKVERLSAPARVKKWRNENRERYNASMREYRRRKRAGSQEGD